MSASGPWLSAVMFHTEKWGLSPDFYPDDVYTRQSEIVIDGKNAFMVVIEAVKFQSDIEILR